MRNFTEKVLRQNPKTNSTTYKFIQNRELTALHHCVHLYIHLYSLFCLFIAVLQSHFYLIFAFELIRLLLSALYISFLFVLLHFIDFLLLLLFTSVYFIHVYYLPLLLCISIPLPKISS